MSRVLKSPGQLVRAMVDDLVTTFFPADCRVCGGPLPGAGLSPLCDECVDALREQLAELCARCGEALDLDGVRFERQMEGAGVLCGPCRMVPPEFERAAAWGVYADGMREAIQLLKYERAESVARPLGRLLARVIERMGAEGMGRELVVIAVPLFQAWQRQRGYNQSVLLAEEAVRKLGRSGASWRLRAAHGALIRTRKTESQFGLSSRERRRNLRGAFTVKDPAAVSGCEVLLVDDIYTTGATARECARVLRHAGASKVWVATVARAQKEMIARWGAQDEMEAVAGD
ncbi:ComF family protein [Edaphobacter modestus]|uniref:ComF family protein n=1 Tax=Edaphobacter modestus TaxID=388466 RepID=A0A4Q7YW00_9BACT|nr:ComF family protein [Edaphobacter modestus]